MAAPSQRPTAPSSPAVPQIRTAYPAAHPVALAIARNGGDPKSPVPWAEWVSLGSESSGEKTPATGSQAAVLDGAATAPVGDVAVVDPHDIPDDPANTEVGAEEAPVVRFVDQTNQRLLEIGWNGAAFEVRQLVGDVWHPITNFTASQINALASAADNSPPPAVSTPPVHQHTASPTAQAVPSPSGRVAATQTPAAAAYNALLQSAAAPIAEPLIPPQQSPYPAHPYPQVHATAAMHPHAPNGPAQPTANFYPPGLAHPTYAQAAHHAMGHGAPFVTALPPPIPTGTPHFMRTPAQSPLTLPAQPPPQYATAPYLGAPGPLHAAPGPLYGHQQAPAQLYHFIPVPVHPQTGQPMLMHDQLHLLAAAGQMFPPSPTQAAAGPVAYPSPAASEDRGSPSPSAGSASPNPHPIQIADFSQLASGPVLFAHGTSDSPINTSPVVSPGGQFGSHNGSPTGSLGAAAGRGAAVTVAGGAGAGGGGPGTGAFIAPNNAAAPGAPLPTSLSTGPIHPLVVHALAALTSSTSSSSTPSSAASLSSLASLLVPALPCPVPGCTLTFHCAPQGVAYDAVARGLVYARPGGGEVADRDCLVVAHVVEDHEAEIAKEDPQHRTRTGRPEKVWHCPYPSCGYQSKKSNVAAHMLSGRTGHHREKHFYCQPCLLVTGQPTYLYNYQSCVAHFEERHAAVVAKRQGGRVSLAQQAARRGGRAAGGEGAARGPGSHPMQAARQAAHPYATKQAVAKTRNRGEEGEVPEVVDDLVESASGGEDGHDNGEPHHTEAGDVADLTEKLGALDVSGKVECEAKSEDETDKRSEDGEAKPEEKAEIADKVKLEEKEEIAEKGTAQAV